MHIVFGMLRVSGLLFVVTGAQDFLGARLGQIERRGNPVSEEYGDQRKEYWATGASGGGRIVRIGHIVTVYTRSTDY
jgi:hypothetical protein